MGLSDEALVELLADIGEQCVLLIEDVDRDNIITHADSQQKKSVDDRDAVKVPEITLAGLLNALDGPTASTGRLLFMTTNNKHLLDEALIRPGRIDYDLQFSHVSEEQIRRLVMKFYDKDAMYAEEIARNLTDSGKEFC